MMSLLLWINCISEGLLGLDARQRAMAQGVAMLLTGVMLNTELPPCYVLLVVWVVWCSSIAVL